MPQDRRPFLSRPFWRDYILGVVLIGFGFIYSGPGSPVSRVIALPVGIVGVLVFVYACSWSLVQLLRRFWSAA